ncbi:hypothetical protein [Shewanella sp. CAL98-MNA-CIBAN-0140]|uniref:hypothetical protein n=1 Tax=unclassified Shewanella TaxID=196818 RepID=UPI003319F47B
MPHEAIEQTLSISRFATYRNAVCTSPGRKYQPKQKIKVEVVNIPAYTKEPQPLQINYDFLPDANSAMHK